MSVNDQLALAILQIVALLFPFVALMYQAFIPDSVGYRRVSDSHIAKIFDPRELTRIIVLLLSLTAAAAVGHFWAKESTSPILMLSISLLMLTLLSIIFLADELVSLNKRAHNRYDEE